MKKLFLTLISVFFLEMVLAAHPLHISVINVSINGTEIAINISTFVDDWESAYFHYNSKPIDLTLEKNYNGEWFTTALMRSLQFRENENSSPLRFTVDKVSFNELAMSIEMHGELKKATKSLYIYNAILTDIFPDQSNLVIISLDKKETGMKFDLKKKQEKLKLR